MNSAIPPTYRLVRRGDPGLACDEDGVALGPVPLVEAEPDSQAKQSFRVRPEKEIARALDLAYGASTEAETARRYRGVVRVGELLAAGEGARARMHAVLLRFPDIGMEGMKKRSAEKELKKFNPDWASEPRVPNGQPGAEEWTSGGGGSTRGRAKQKKPTPEDVPAKKQKFLDDHMADAQNGADELGIPVENILGLSALESGWGKSRFAAEGQNYFGLHAPSPFQTGTIQATKTKRKVEVATFRSYADSLNSFIARYGSLIRGVSDPKTFARILQNTGSFGVDEDGRKRPEYVPDVDATIRGFRPYAARWRLRQ
jgi:hypothetical protein